jgi:c-di-GMP-binding flagellar brake protein YcgR
MPNDDRRTHERYPARVNVTLRPAKGESMRVASRDLSAGGLFLECTPALTQSLALNDKVQVTIHYEDTGEAETIHADVVRLDQEGIGLRFDRNKAIQSAA